MFFIFFDLLKAKREDVIRFTKDDLKSEINNLFLALGFTGGIKDVLDYQIKYAKELKLSDINLEKAKINKSLIMLKTKVETEDKYLNASIYEKVKELIQHCDQTTSVDIKKQILAQIEAIKVEHHKQRAALNSSFNSAYERVIHEMLTAWIDGIGLAQVWTKETYNEVIKGLSQEVGSYFDIHINNVSKQDLKQKIYTRYTPVWGKALENEPKFTENDKFVEFREKVISLKNKGKNNQDLIEFFDKLVETLVLTFEESKGLVYV